MFESLWELVPELLYAGLAGALTLLGLFVENTGIQTLGSGETTVGLWMTAVGLVALYAGLKLAREKVLPTLRAA